MIGNKIANKITKVSKNSSQNNSEVVESETRSIGFDRKIPRERYTFSKKDRKLMMI